MGELAGYYGAADVAVIGGSLLPYGGQNLIEAAAMGCPLLLGPHTWNFLDVAERAVAAGAALRVHDCASLAAEVVRLHGDPDARQAMGAAGRAFSQAHRGATERVMALLEPTLNRCSRP
jgi:3-deoxy-D-manno-octulosonic-acid transferase